MNNLDCSTNEIFNCELSDKEDSSYCPTHKIFNCKCPDEKEYSSYCPTHKFNDCNCKEKKISFNGYLLESILKEDQTCYRCGGDGATNYDQISVYNSDWFHGKCPMICKNGHQILEYIPVYKYSKEYYNFNHEYHCVEGCIVMHYDVYPYITAGDYYNYD